MVGAWHFPASQDKRGLSTGVFEFQATADKIPSFGPWEAGSNWNRPVRSLFQFQTDFTVEGQESSWANGKDTGPDTQRAESGISVVFCLHAVPRASPKPLSLVSYMVPVSVMSDDDSYSFCLAELFVGSHEMQTINYQPYAVDRLDTLD